MADSMILKIMEQAIEDKVRIDLEIEMNPNYEMRKTQGFSNFLYDNILM